MLKIAYNYNTIAIQFRDESKLSESSAFLWASPHCLTGSPVLLSPNPAIDFVHWFLLKRILSSRVWMKMIMHMAHVAGCFATAVWKDDCTRSCVPPEGPELKLLIERQHGFKG
jgi:hypothetical protein